MTNRNGTDGEPQVGDYRDSHLHKGESYDKTLDEDAFDAFMSRREDALLATIVPKLFPGGIPRYLDFACGTGRVLSRVATYATTSMGVDISETMLAQARVKCPSSTLLHMDLTTADSELGVFDLITTFRFVGNAQDALRESALAALSRRLAPGGYLVLDSHRNPWSIRNLLHPGSARDQDLHLSKLRSLLRKHGLTVVQTHGVGWWIVLDSQNTRSHLTSSLANLLERVPVGRTPLAWFCPDSVVVARKAR